MTTLQQERVVCRACGDESEHTYVAGSSELEPADLDTRPGEMLRSTMAHWVQRCPGCGCCAPDLSEAPASAARVVATAAYRALLDAAEYPALANRFLCSSAVLEHAGQLADAGWQVVYAAWACDDSPGHAQAAAECRAHAVELFDRARAAGQSFADTHATEDAVVTDLLRRRGDFAAAEARAEAALEAAPEPLTARVLQRELALIAAEDAARHTSAEASAGSGAVN